MIELQNVSKSYRGKRVLSDVSVSIQPGEFVCITGPSGAGKSTLLHIMAGAEAPTEGAVLVDGQDLFALPLKSKRTFRRRTGVVFQDYKLLPHFTVKENIAFPLEICGDLPAYIKKRSTDLLSSVGLTKHADSFPDDLSGGEQARTAIARAIAHAPMIIYADEPTGNLDRAQSEEIMRLFLDIHRQGTTVIVATHDEKLVEMLNCHVIHVENGRIASDTLGKNERFTKKTGSHEILDGIGQKKTDGPSFEKVKVIRG